MAGLPRAPRRTALVICASALLGGALAVIIALAAGLLHASSQTTTVVTPEAPATATAVAAARSVRPWSAIYAQVAPGTVDITVKALTTIDTPFGRSQVQSTSTGSGFVLDAGGHILTAAHLVSGATAITVTFQDGATRSAKLLGRDNSSDLAVISVATAGLTLHPLRLGSARAIAVGDPLAIVGDPLGFARSLSTGVVSALDRTIEAPSGYMIAHAIQTDAEMNPGNSGGPLFDGQGQVIGIADQIATGSNQFGTGSATSTGVGFAVPIDLAKAELTALEHGQTVTHAYLGVGTATATSGGRSGALLSSLQSGGPAAAAGLRTGDLIIAFGSRTIRSSGELIAALADSHPGETVRLTVLRGTARVTISVTLATQPAQAGA